jgi:molybdopterin-guanine dinucleotide biosynthesis protein A
MSMNAVEDHRQDVTLGVLAGGEGRRHGGADKGLVEWRGRPLVAHVIDRCQPQTEAVIITANRNLERYRTLGYPVVRDAWGDTQFPGPLAGLVTLLQHCRTPLLQLVACDMPLLPTDLIPRLRTALAGAAAGVAAPRVDGHNQWACTLWRRSLLPEVQGAFENGERSLRAAARKVGVVTVEFETDGFVNANAPGVLPP